MRVQLISDVHLEFHRDRGRAFIDSLRPDGVDVLVVAGDLSTLRAGLEDALRRLCDRYREVVFVAGNHSFYGSSPHEVMRLKRDLRLPNLHWLENGVAEVDGVRFAGCTLWFPEIAGRSNYLNDFHQVRDFVPWVYGQCERSKAFLRSTLRSGDVLVTHHLPSEKSVAKQFVGDPLNKYFVCDVEDVIVERKPILALHGHTHASCDYWIGGHTRVLCNPLGYVGHEENPDFRDDLVVDVNFLNSEGEVPR